jgi:tRNA nucleotidyltransferase/poly(A) polymerase/alpha-beta hydrolase superfamily lysophospholipase
MGLDKSSNANLDPYIWCLVALIRGKVVAQGGTPGQVVRVAQKSRYKEKPEILFVKGLDDLKFPPLFEVVRKLLIKENDVFLVGGAVRDVFLNRTSHDLDFAVKKNAIQLARKVADKLNADFYPLDSDRDTGRVLVKGADGTRQVIDFAAFRGENLDSDLHARDFSINAMAIDLNDLSLHDPLGGLLDLREKCLRACSDTIFKDDPVRILRAIRLATTFGFRIQPEMRKAMKEDADLLNTASPERQRDELFRILEGPKPATSLKALDLLGALKPVLPELTNLKGVLQTPPHVNDVWSHTLSVISHLESILATLTAEYHPESASDYFHGLLVLKIGRYRKHISEHFSNVHNSNRTWREILFFSALYHDIAKPEKSVTGMEGRIRFWGHEADGADIVSLRAQKLALSNDEINRLKKIVQNHMRIHYHTRRLADENKLPTRRAIFRFFRDNGEAGVDICLLTLADLWATYDNTLPEKTWETCLDVVRIFLESWWEKKTELIAPPQLISGNDLMSALALEPGQEVGLLLDAVREAQVVHELADVDSAMNYAREYQAKLHAGKIKENVFLKNTKLVFFQRPGKGIPLILLHGYPLDHSIWQPIIPYLQNDAHLIMPDLPGYGSTPIPERIYSIEQMADDIVGLLDFLRIKKAIVVGHSMGGYVALAFAQKYEHRLMGLGLVASRMNSDNLSQKEARYKMIADIELNGMDPVAESMASRLVADPLLIPDLRNLILKTDPAGAIGALNAMAGRNDSSSVIENLKTPLLLIAGTDDALIPIDSCRQMKELSPNCTYLEIEKVGHMPMLESPQKTAEAINELVRTI